MSVKFPLIALLLAAILLITFTQRAVITTRHPLPAPDSHSTEAPRANSPEMKSAAQAFTRLAAQTTPNREAKAEATSEFARLVEKLSEPGGYFDTDNLISNETSYLHVMGKLRQLKVEGGAYIGVGPDQNFSYVAQIRPRIAFMIDIRRDNLLQHLFFKALFEQARSRLEYLCLLFGKPIPANLKEWDQRGIQQLVDYLEKTPAKRELFEATAKAVRARVSGYGLPLKPEELETISRIHSSFFTAGLELRFTSHGRSPRSYYPTYRDLLLEKDLTGKQANYLVSEDDFRFVKTLEEQNRIIPVVGNLAGNHALAAIGQLLTERGEKVSAFYTSNVEYYLMHDDSFDRFAQNVK